MKSRIWVLLGATLVLTGCSDLLSRGHAYGTVTVLTLDAGGAPLAGVGLRLYRFHYLLGEGTTDADGVHEFTFVPRGPLEVRASPPPGYALSPDAVTDFDEWIARGQRVQVELVFVQVDTAAADAAVP